MLADEVCKNPGDAWFLVSHFVGNFLLNVQLALSGKEDDLEEIASLAKKELVKSLSEIALKMFEKGHGDDATKVMVMAGMVILSDLTSLEAIRAVHQKSHSLGGAI